MIRLGTPFLIMAPVILCSPALARSPGCSGNPFDLRCNPSDFTDPVLGTPGWYRENRIAAEAMVRDCTRPPPFPGWKPPPQLWCRAAASAILGRPAR